MILLEPPAPTRDAQASRDLIHLPGSPWSLWSCVCLRGAGFPVTAMLQLSSPACARLALRRLEERTNRGARQPAAGGETTVPARVALAETLAAETPRIRGVLRDIARQPAFREAVLWQNPGALRHAVDELLAAPADLVNSVTRKKELLVASYVQRYHTKNDTIGFFGPVGWARVSQTTPAMAVTCGPGLVSARSLYVESWCIDAIAGALDADAGLQPWRVPRVAPFLHVEETRLMIGRRVARELPVDHLRLLAACDGRRHARAIAAALVSEGCAAFPAEASIYTVLEEWRQAGFITWTLEGPRELHAERTLRRRLEQVDDASVRARSLACLGRFEAAVQRVRETAGDVDVLEVAMEGLESAFTVLTGIPATRSAGEMYAARTLAYEECRRDTVVDLGAPVIARLSRPLALVLQGARWALHELARRHEAEFRQAYDHLAGPERAPVGFGAFLGRTSLRRTAPGTLSAIATEVRAALQQRWADVLAVPVGTRRIQYRSREIRPAVLAAFKTDGDPPSSWTRYVSPDVMIDASSVEAIHRGEYQFVMGEVHPYNTLLQAAFIDQHPRPDEIAQWLDLDVPDPRVVWITPKDTMPQRVQFFLRPNDCGYTSTPDPSPVPPERTLRTGDLEVADEAGTLVVRTRDGQRRFTCLEFFGSVMMRAAAGLFHVLPPARHLPRVTIDDLVVVREQWQVPASEMTFATRGDDLDKYVECQRWARDRGIPQFVFVKMPTERKPTYVDLSSPLFVDLFARFVRRVQTADPAALIAVTEMLPAPGGAWLPDAAGERYTCELRIVAVEPP